MTQRKSNFLKGAGKLWEIQKSIVDEVLKQGGSDEDIERILTDEKLRRDIANRILQDQNTFTIEVDYDDPRWKTLPKPDSVKSIGANITCEDYKHGSSGKVLAKVILVSCDTTLRLFDAILSSKYSTCDRPTTETFLDIYQNINKGIIISPCGLKDKQSRACIEEKFGNRKYCWYSMKDSEFPPKVKFLYLMEIKPNN